MNNLKVCVWGKFLPDGMLTFMCREFGYERKEVQTYLFFEGISLEGNIQTRYFKPEDVTGYTIEYLTK